LVACAYVAADKTPTPAEVVLVVGSAVANFTLAKGCLDSDSQTKGNVHCRSASNPNFFNPNPNPTALAKGRTAQL
jgi:hypothetical protein